MTVEVTGLGGLLALALVCLTVMFCVVSCGKTAVQVNEITAKAKQQCFAGGGAWNMWTGACDVVAR